MRKLLRQYLLSNILTANIAWPVLPILYIPRYRAINKPGPTRLPRRTGQPAPKRNILRNIAIAVLAFVALLSLLLGVTSKANDPLKPVASISFWVSLVLLIAFVALTALRRQSTRD